MWLYQCVRITIKTKQLYTENKYYVKSDDIGLLGLYIIIVSIYVLCDTWKYTVIVWLRAMTLVLVQSDSLLCAITIVIVSHNVSRQLSLL